MMTFETFESRAIAGFRQLAEREPDAGDRQDMYNWWKNSSDAAALGPPGFGLSSPEGSADQQLARYLDGVAVRFKRPTASGGGVGGDADPTGALTWTPPAALMASVQQIIQSALAGVTTATSTTVTPPDVRYASLPVTTAPDVAQAIAAPQLSLVPLLLIAVVVVLAVRS